MDTLPLNDKELIKEPVLTPNERKYCDPIAERISQMLNYAPDSVLSALDNFHIRSDDIMLAVYPRSGTHWLKEIVSLITLGGDVEHAQKVHLSDRVPYLEIRPDGEPQKDKPLESLEQIPSPRILSTHLDYDRVPPGVRQGKCKIIVMLRNPKDVCDSMYHFETSLNLDESTWDEHFRDFVQGPCAPFGTWFDHTLGWWKRRHELPILFVKFEDAKQDLRSTVITVASFLGVTLDNDKVDRIVTHCSFAKMKTNPQIDPLNLLGFMPKTSPFMRKGQVGGWKTKFTVAQNEEYDRIYQTLIADTGLQLQFDAKS